MNRKWNHFDVEREKKELEAERRKLRILQVREESKKLAKNLRTKVADEKNRQLRTFEENKTKELDCWRQNSLQQKLKDYRSSIFEIGAAHKAAAAEKRLEAARCNKNAQLKVETTANKRPLNSEVTVPRNKTREGVAEGTDNAASKRPKSFGNPKHVGFCEINPKNRNVLGGFENDDHCMNKEVEVEGRVHQETKKKQFERSPVIVDIDVENCDNVSISEFDVDDTHVQSNRKFTRVVRLTPKKNVTTKIFVQKGDHDKSNDKVVYSESPKPKAVQMPKKLDNVEIKAVSLQEPVVRPRKRISAISDFLSNHLKIAPGQECNQENDVSVMQGKVDLLFKKDKENVRNHEILNKSKSILEAFEQKKQRLAQLQEMDLSSCCLNQEPKSCTGALNILQEAPTNKQPEPWKPAYRKEPEVLKPTEYNQDKKGTAAKDSSTVEYYDYVNRYGKTYKQPSNLIQIETANAKTLNAIELAKQEKKTEELARIAKLQKQRADMLERGRKATDKEQQTIECHKITEQLDNFIGKHSETLLKNDKVNASQTKPKDIEINPDEILLQPAIITCPLVEDISAIPAYKKEGFNLADIPDNRSAMPPVTNMFLLNECEMLMDPVKKMASNLNEQSDPQKADKLKMLMSRVEDLRAALIEELKKEGDVIGEPVKKMNVQKAKTEANLYKLVNGQKTSERKLDKAKDKDSTAKNIKVSSSEAPFEIIIQVNGKDIIDIKQKQGDKNQSLLSKPQQSPGKVKNNIQCHMTTSNDSNSTSYKSLPPWPRPNRGEKSRERYDSINSQESLMIHPLVEHYIQRLLFMNRKSIDDLCVSSSDIDTPNTTVICASENKMPSSESLNEAKLRQMEKFISDNRSFINQLESSITSQRDMTPKQTLEIFDAIWQNRLGNAEKVIKHKQQPPVPNDDAKAFKKCKPKSVRYTDRERREDSSAKESTSVSLSEASKANQKPLPCAARKTVGNEKKCVSEVQIERYAELTENCTQRIKELTELITLVRQEKKKLLEVTLSSISDTGRNSTEYFELPGDRKSFPDSTKSSEWAARTNSTSPLSSEEGKVSRNRTLNEHPLNSECDQQSSAAHNQRDLVQGKKISTSLDSGISGSRPVTVLEQQPEINMRNLEGARPHSPNSMSARKSRPPPTLNRFSPHMVDGEKIHELSTITEVETPITSKINTSAGGNVPPFETSTYNKSPQPQSSQNTLTAGFPTFEEYMRNHAKLDWSSFTRDGDDGARLQQEFNNYVASLSKAKISGASIDRFPDFSSYIEFNCTPALQASSMEENINEAIDKMRQQEILVKPFPSKSEYIRDFCKANSMPCFIDSDSLDNISDNTQSNKPMPDSGSESIDIEQELRKRNLLHKDFRRHRHASGDTNFAESTRNDAYNSRVSSLDSLSPANRIAPNSLMDQRNRREPRLKYTSESDISSTTTSITIPTPGKSDRATSTCGKAETTECKTVGKPLNLREFLSRELEKHSRSSLSTTTCSNDSIRNLFLQSILDNLSPSGDGESTAVAGGTGLTLDRQKTSTPVASSNPNTLSPRASSNFFSGESQISSVAPYQESERLNLGCGVCKKKKCTCNSK